MSLVPPHFVKFVEAYPKFNTYIVPVYVLLVLVGDWTHIIVGQWRLSLIACAVSKMESVMLSFTRYMDLCARSCYQGQGQVFISHRYFGVQLLIHDFDNWFWQTCSQIPNRTHSAKHQILYEYAIDRLGNGPESICEICFWMIGYIKMVSLFVIFKLSSYFGDAESTLRRSKLWPNIIKVKLMIMFNIYLFDLLHSGGYSNILRTFRLSIERHADLTRAHFTNMD